MSVETLDPAEAAPALSPRRKAVGFDPASALLRSIGRHWEDKLDG
jgi:hypothetical protein